MPTGSRVRGSGFRVRTGLAVGLMLALALSAATEPAGAQPPRVIALAPHLAELAFAAGAGDALVGTVAWSDYPAEAAELPLIGDAFRLDLERVLGLDPDLALAWEGGTPAAAAERLEELGIEVAWIRIGRLEEIGSALVEIGRRLGRPDRGQQAAKDYRSALAERPEPAEADLPTFYQVSERPLYTLGGRHILTEVLRRCGARNIFADLDVEASAVDYEAVLARQPAVIVAGTEPGGDDPLQRWRRDRDHLPDDLSLIAVEPDTLIRPTPRIIDGIDLLCRLLP
ncbi:helical backbone metal receptor [Wenzhouxiangella limi]|uniref:ABC transporter substrate-binding protein n=1 Tax=Wenzhouxiangella limi TaxID=2707351 RepID=A0A845V7I4_9GAMM|nr:helical backbone metal receptor [Wenzhouxiangella limi]NDY95905.1 ABC transporter substrate-binding protein [Wenzhouxiangella limi]